MTCKLARVLRPSSGVYVVNRSTLVTDADVQRWTAACARQIREHVAPTYDLPPRRVQFLSRTSHAPRGAWVLVVLDDADQAGALGYHSETRDGRVFGRVFAGPCLQYGVPVSTTLSHEVVETFVDPDVDQWRDTGRGYEVAYEACDPVEGDSYPIDGVAVSDFVTPGWYSLYPPTGRLHWLDNGKVTQPFGLAPGGYVVRRFPNGTEDQEFGQQANREYVAAKRHELARTRRRGI
jgi:hypothetical protein